MAIPPPPPPTSKPPRRWYFRWYMWITYGVVGLCTIGIIGAALAPPEPTDTAEGVAEVADDVSEGVDKSDPVTTPSEEQTEHPEDWFEPVTYEGASDEVINLPEGAVKGIVTASYDGGGSFIITALNANNEMTGSVIMEFGSYTGSTTFGLSPLDGDPVRLEVAADGDWAITVAHLSTAPVLELPAEGDSDAVYWYEGGAATWHMTHEGDGAFIVIAHADQFGWMSTEFGTYEGTVPVGAEAGLITIDADGPWTITTA